MIVELPNFVNHLSPDVFEYNLNLEDGIYFEIDLDEEGNPIIVNQEEYGIKLKEDKTDSKLKTKREQEDKPKELSEFLRKCLQLQTVTKMSSRSTSASTLPRRFSFKLHRLLHWDLKKKLLKRKSATAQNFKRHSKAISIGPAIVKPENEQHQSWLSALKSFCTGEMLDWVRSQDIYQKAPDKAVVRIFYTKPAFEDFQTVYDAYLNANASEDDKETGKGVSEMMSKFPNQKVFMAHQSAPFIVNFKVSSEVGKSLWQFFQLQKRKPKVLPNPLPIFIDKKELNGKTIAVLKEDD